MTLARFALINCCENLTWSFTLWDMMPLLRIHKMQLDANLHDESKHELLWHKFSRLVGVVDMIKAKENFQDFSCSSVYSTCLLIDFLCNQIFHCSFFCRNKAKSISKHGTTSSCHSSRFSLWWFVENKEELNVYKFFFWQNVTFRWHRHNLWFIYRKCEEETSEQS